MGKKKVTITYLYGYLENWRKNQKEPFPNFGRCFSRFEKNITNTILTITNNL